MRHPNTGRGWKNNGSWVRRICFGATVKSDTPDFENSEELLVDAKRREVLKAGGGVLALAAAAGIVRPGEALAQEWNKAAFDTKSVAETVKALGGSGSTPSSAIEITAPDIAENGAVVPVAVESKLPRTQAIAILIEKNPNTLSAEFEIPAGTDPFVSTRVKMAETSNIYALVIADGKYFHAVKEIKVTIGGCGG
jgi:sulfur-oxidizing protein SoxY